jgi:hypothetical protein
MAAAIVCWCIKKFHSSKKKKWQQQGLKKKILTPTKVHVNCQNNNKTKRVKMKRECLKTTSLLKPNEEISIPFPHSF